MKKHILSLLYCARSQRAVLARNTACLLFASALSSPIFADNIDPSTGESVKENTSNLVTYLLNLGSYLGYNLKQVPPQNSTSFVSATTDQLIGATSGTGPSQPPFFTTLLYDFFGAIPVSATSKQFIPSNSGGDTSINDHADATYAAYATPSASGTVSVNSAIDQQTYQPDPVSQGLLNLLGTPDVSFCMDSSETHWNSDCKLLVSQLVKSNIIGTLPKPNEFFSYGYNQKFLSQLNASTLLGPLLYSTDPGAPPSGNTQPGQNSGLTAQNQAQEAFNYIRYATNSVAPQSTPSQKNYSKTYFTAFPPKGTTAPSLTVQMQAQGSLSTYFSKLRVFAAQTSVVYGNLYYLFAKRMPQKREGGNSQTSDALNEMTMATWRLFTPSGASKKDWLNQINQASSATVGKEAAVLLAEINYQLYLMRQQQERILLTNSLILSTVTLQGYPNLQQQK